MDVLKGLFLLLLHLHHLMANDKLSSLEWRGRCTVNALALNDCNWCRCNKNHRYTCDVRDCSLVDKFGHFNDAIQDINVGMEGKGSWRTTATACEPGVQYRRADLLCVCTDEGTWPNPVCRDTFRILHSVEQTGDTEVTGQTCSSTKLYLIGCNVCFCPSTGQLDPNLCTQNVCTNDPILKNKQDNEQMKNDHEIYAECNPSKMYKLGCKTCKCLKNNRLQCNNCSTEKAKSFCSYFNPGQLFTKDCNLCYCDEKGFAFCTARKCLTQQTSFPFQNLSKLVVLNEPFDEDNCVPGHSYKSGCSICACDWIDGKKFFTCTMKPCHTTNKNEDIHNDCVKGTFYESNCLVCQCDEIDSIKTQSCTENPICTSKKAIREERSLDLDSLHGYCEPLHVYTRDCNSCQCLSDGKTVKCTSYVCETPMLPVSVEIVPVAQSGSCRRGVSYRIQCNYCFCLSDGNALCTMRDCK